jgi:hypothetical protein
MTQKEMIQVSTRVSASLILPKGLLEDLCSMIDRTKNSVARSVNSEYTMLYWKVGERVHKEVLKETRAEYGQSVVTAISRQLTLEYGKGFSEKTYAG